MILITLGLCIFIGMCISLNLYGLFEDISYLTMGADKYFEWYKSSFISPKITIPYHIIALMILGYAIYKLFAYFK